MPCSILGVAICVFLIYLLHHNFPKLPWLTIPLPSELFWDLSSFLHLSVSTLAELSNFHISMALTKNELIISDTWSQNDKSAYY